MAEIIELLERREERALELLREQYGAYCRTIIWNLLQNEQETEEALNDVWMQVWNSIPPAQPRRLQAYLARVCRNVAINYIQRNQAAKRRGTLVVIDELAECIPDPGWENRHRSEELRGLIGGFVRSLGGQDRRLFIRRYWYGETVPELAASLGWSESRITSKLYRMRKGLRKYLEREGYQL